MYIIFSLFKVSVIKDVNEFETNYPLFAAVNRCARGETESLIVGWASSITSGYQ